MSQSKRQSAIEAVTNTTVGYVIAICSQLAIFPAFGVHIPLSSNIAIGAWFTLVSLVRSYVLRRLFSRM